MALPSFLRVFASFSNPARGASSGTMSEWFPSYNAKNPYNTVIASTSGHMIEMDDTPESERLQFTHHKGSHIEMRPDGSVKYKSVKNRQDVTIGDHEIMIRGDFNITVDGGSKILVRNGSLEIQADHGAAVNVKGELKLHADNIRLQALKKISLVAPSVDIGGGGATPYISLPASTVPVFGVPVPVITGFPATKMTPISAPSAGANPAAGVASLVTAVTAILTQLNTIASYTNNIGKSKQYVAALRDSNGDPVVPLVDQPDEIPLKNPRVYSGKTLNDISFRDRQFDTPDDVDNAELYTAHLNLMQELGDLVPADKDLPGQLIESDTTDPEPEPKPPVAFLVPHGTVSVASGSDIVYGTDTEFTTDVSSGQYIKIADFDCRIKMVQDDTTLVLEDVWNNVDQIDVDMFVYKLRPFIEFMDTYSYGLDAQLGDSIFVLGDLLKNYIPPTIEKDTTSVPVPPAPSLPVTPFGGGAVDIPTPETYNDKTGAENI